eukprot:COSAG06_NODE_1521_length_9206_cov_45.018667_4_plen_77_part_00
MTYVSIYYAICGLFIMAYVFRVCRYAGYENATDYTSQGHPAYARWMRHPPPPPISFAPFYTSPNNDHFAKTSSGQT